MLRYLVVDQTYLDVDYANLTFDKSKKKSNSAYAVGNASTSYNSNCVILCRSSTITLNYQYKNKNQLAVYPYLVGFYVSDVPDLTEAKNLK